MKRHLCIALIGPTASGKTTFALQLASRFPAEILCMDSTTVYRGFDIGTSKPTAPERAQAPHHLLDILDPNEPFSAFHFVQYADDLLTQIAERGKIPVVVGGTYFYMRALQNGIYPTSVISAEVIEGIEREFFDDESWNTPAMHAELKEKDPNAAKAIHPNDKYRLIRALSILRGTQDKPSELKAEPISEAQPSRLWIKYAIATPRHQLNQSIVRRTEKMLQGGLVKETAELTEKFPNARALGSIGYSEVSQFLKKQLTEKQLRNEIIEKTRQLAKRQTTWLRSDSEVRYVDFRDLDRIQKEIENLRFTLGEI